jgi:hypothetical protein
LRRVNTRQSVENSHEGSTQYDGSTISFIGSGLDSFSSIRITNKLGKVRLTGLAFTPTLDGTEGTGMVHPQQLATTLSANQIPTLNQDTTGTATNQSGGTVSATTIDASGIITCNANKIVITGDAPTLYLRDSDERTGMIHMNSNRMYFLSGAANSDTWTQINGQWPLYLQTDTNAAVFGGTVTAPTFSGALSGNATTATSAGSVTNGVYTTGTQSIAGTKTFTSEAKFCVSGHTSHIGYSTNRDWYIRSGLSAGQVILQDTGGYVGIGTSSPAYTLDVTGDIYATGDVTASSDRRLKTDIKRIENALDKVCSLGGYTYVMNDKPSSGLIAQEVLEVLPEVVHGSEETNYSLAYGNIVGLLVEAIKELKEKVG